MPTAISFQTGIPLTYTVANDGNYTAHAPTGFLRILTLRATSPASVKLTLSGPSTIQHNDLTVQSGITLDLSVTGYWRIDATSATSLKANVTGNSGYLRGSSSGSNDITVSGSVTTLTLPGSNNVVVVEPTGKISDIHLSGNGATIIVKSGGDIGTITGAGAGSIETLTIEPGAKVGQIDLGEGSDQITFSAGSGRTVLKSGLETGTGDDTIIIGAGHIVDASSTISTGEGNDSLTINDNAQLIGSSIQTGAGNDTVTIGQNAQVRLGYNKSIELGSGADTLSLAAGAEVDGHIDAGSDDDWLLLNGTVKGNVTGGTGNDRIDIGGQVSGSVAGGAGADTIYVGGVVQGHLSGDGGADNIIVDSGGSVMDGISGGDGNDTITTNGMVIGGISGDAGNDSIKAVDQVYGDVSGGDGNDTIETHASVSGNIIGGYGADYIKVHGSVGGNVFGDNTGIFLDSSGHDTIIIDNPNEAIGGFAIYAGSGDNLISVTEGSHYIGVSGEVSGRGYLAASAYEGNDTLSIGDNATLEGFSTLADGDNTIYLGRQALLNTSTASTSTGYGSDTVTLSENSTLVGRIDLGLGADKVFVHGGAGGEGLIHGGAQAGITDRLYIDFPKFPEVTYAFLESHGYVVDGTGFTFVPIFGRTVADITINGIRYVDFERINPLVPGTTPKAPCFTLGTLIATPKGLRPVESLKVGDMILTMDQGPQPLMWTCCNPIPDHAVKENPRYRPIAIAPNALGPGRPMRTMRVSNQHRIWFRAPSGREVLIPAIALLGLPGITRDESCDPVVYFHLFFTKHQLLLSDGVVSESFAPGLQILQNMDPSLSADLLARFPDLAKGTYALARPEMRGKQAQKLLAKLVEKAQPLQAAMKSIVPFRSQRIRTALHPIMLAHVPQPEDFVERRLDEGPFPHHLHLSEPSSKQAQTTQQLVRLAGGRGNAAQPRQ